MKNLFKGLTLALLLVLTGAMIVSTYRLTDIAQSLERIAFYGKRVSNKVTETTEEMNNLYSKISELNTRVAELGEKASSIFDKVASLEKKVESYEEIPLLDHLPSIPESLLDDINRFQAEKAKQEGKNQTDPPESDPFGELFESIPDEPPPLPKEEHVPEVVEYDRLVI